MHILVVSNIEWSDENAFGNTISNWFEGMQDVHFSSIYCRNSLPNNRVCQRYYSIPPLTIMRNFFNREKIGRDFPTKQIQETFTRVNNHDTKERKFIQFLHRYNIRFVHSITGFLFRTMWWDNRKFRNFILKDKPNIIFTFATSSEPVYLIIKAIKQLVSSCQVVVFIADDVFGNAGKAGRRRIQEVICSADVVFGISPMLCEAYQKKFGVPVRLLRKGCHLSPKLPLKTTGNIMTMVYAGNLHYGRDETLAMLAREIIAYNQNNDKKIILKIFSGSELKDEFAGCLNDGKNVFFLGSRPNQEIQHELSSATFALHIESFSPQWQRIVRYSFSTKITDCMESGSILFAIGPDTIASIAIAKDIPGVILVNSPKELGDVLNGVCNMDLEERRQAIHEYALANFDIKKVQEKLLSDFRELCG